jgi:hypothetical protein
MPDALDVAVHPFGKLYTAQGYPKQAEAGPFLLGSLFEALPFDTDDQVLAHRSLHAFNTYSR